MRKITKSALPPANEAGTLSGILQKSRAPQPKAPTKSASLMTSADFLSVANGQTKPDKGKMENPTTSVSKNAIRR